MAFYTPNKQPDLSIDFELETAVPVICSWDTSGNMRPLYVRINGISCEVLSCWCQPILFVENEYKRLVYHCTVHCENHRREVMLTYQKGPHIWTLRNKSK